MNFYFLMFFIVPAIMAKTFKDYTGPLGDVSCYHQQNWLLNTNQNYNSKFSAYTDVQSSTYLSSTNRRLQVKPPNPPPKSTPSSTPPSTTTVPVKPAPSDPPAKSAPLPAKPAPSDPPAKSAPLPAPAEPVPPSTPTSSKPPPPKPSPSQSPNPNPSGPPPGLPQPGNPPQGSSPPASDGGQPKAKAFPLLTVGWKVQSSGIPMYNHTLTTFDMSLLNSRPKKTTDFTGGVTSVKQDQIVAFGESVGYSVTMGCTTSGYWPPGPRCPASQTNQYVFPLDPKPETSSAGCYTSTSLGYFVNGIPIYSWGDTTSYNGGGVWHNLALEFEKYDVDICFGHAGATNDYHHHSYSPCLLQLLGDDGLEHSPIHGFAWDGYPVFGPYQGANKQLAVSCWQMRNYAASSPTGCSDGKRSCQLNDIYDYKKGTKSVANGPSLTGTVTTQSSNTIRAASGIYFEDFFFNESCYVQGGPYLDSHNGHDHDGIGYHYHVTMDSSFSPTFPYTFGPKFYGCLRSNSYGCGSSYLDGTSLNPSLTGTSTCGTSSVPSMSCTATTTVRSLRGLTE